MNRRELLLWGILLALSVLLVSGFVSGGTRLGQRNEAEAQPLIDLAKADLAQRLNLQPEAILVQSVEATQFPDSSLGVPEPGKMYLMVITPGYVIRLVANGRVYEYHGSGNYVVLATK
ncbi:MAG: hypothetical protein H5T68_01740 [Chloroflexi bacterium]|nr:hypothetical protein [Chloroflexota bacterium]